MKHPCIEYLSKLALFRLLDERQDLILSYTNSVNWNGRNLCEVLGITKNLLTIAIIADVPSKSLKILQQVSCAGKTISVEELCWMKKHYSFSLVKYLASFLKYMTTHVFIKYVESQNAKNTGNIISDWNDYLGNVALIGYNMRSKSILFPKCLKKAHDRAYKLVTVKKDALFTKRIEDMAEALNKLYSFSYEKFLIRPPKNLDELTHEGETLHHCVATYAEDVAQGKTVILFIRAVSNPDTPLFTLEVKDNHVMQVRGLKDCDPTPEGLQFVEAWKQKCLMCKQQKLCA